MESIGLECSLILIAIHNSGNNLVNGLRACPICPNCGSKKFKVVESAKESVIIECLNCAKKISV